MTETQFGLPAIRIRGINVFRATVNSVTVTDRPIVWGRPRRDRIEGALVHAMGAHIVVDDTVHDAHSFLASSPDLLGVTLSVHALIEPDGTVVRCVAEDREAYHAGWSRLGELEYLNRSFLGAELLLAGQWDYAAFRSEMMTGAVGYTDEQYESAAWLYASWATVHGFGWDRIVGHSTVSGDAVRGEGKGKHDPGVGWNVGRGSPALSTH